MASGWIKGQTLWVRHGREKIGTIFVIRRAIGIATKRNRLKRRLRSICREIAPVPECLVILPLPIATESSYQRLRAELAELVFKLEKYSE